MTVGYDHVIALDVGGATLKASCIPMTPSTDDSLSNPSHIKTTEAPYLLANHVATLTSSTTMLMGADLIAKERQRGKLHYIRPIERGYCVNWNIETEIWNHLFSSKMMNTRSNLSTQALVATAPLFSPTVLLETMDQVVFEEFGWNAFVRVNSAEMSILSYADQCQQQENDIPLVEDSWRGFHRSSCHLVIDSGFSFTHVIPVIQHCVYLPGVKRMNVGGKLLTNYLKEVVSFRQWNVMEETIVINELKEQLCYCSLDFNTEIKRYHTERTSRKHWILPDFVHSFHGKILDQNIHKEHEQTLEMGVEMISVPEILFHPSDIGLDQAGLAEVIMQSILKCPEEYHASLLDNILLVGGNIQFPNFEQRLYQDLRPLVPDNFSISIHCAPDPILAAWKGCTLFGSNRETMSSRVVTKQEYEEYGSNICRKRFR